jgi:DNA-binding response OmpR family regulator
MPHLNGKEVLRIIKNDRVLKEVPVVMYTTSDRSTDHNMCLNLGAAFYVVKASNFNVAVSDIRNVLASLHSKP